MALAGNIIWWLTLNVLLSLVWFIIGLIMFALVITIPFGRACFTIAKLCLAPFGKDVISTAELRAAKAYFAEQGRDGEEDAALELAGKATTMTLQSVGGIAKVIWFPFGLLLAIGHAAIGAFFFVLILTIPLGIQHFKIAGLSLLPVGKRVVTKEMGTKVREAKAEQELKRSHSADNMSTN